MKRQRRGNILRVQIKMLVNVMVVKKEGSGPRRNIDKTHIPHLVQLPLYLQVINDSKPIMVQDTRYLFQSSVEQSPPSYPHSCSCGKLHHGVILYHKGVCYTYGLIVHFQWEYPLVKGTIGGNKLQKQHICLSCEGHYIQYRRGHNHLYALSTRQDLQSSQDVATSMLYVFSFDVYVLLGPHFTLS